MLSSVYLSVDIWKVFQCYHVHHLFCPYPLFIAYQTVLEESQRFMCPDSHQTLHRQGLQRPQGFINPSHPSGHLSGTVDVMRLHVLSEPLLQRMDREKKGERERGNGMGGDGEVGWREKKRERIERRQGKEELIKLQILCTGGTGMNWRNQNEWIKNVCYRSTLFPLL